MGRSCHCITLFRCWHALFLIVAIAAQHNPLLGDPLYNDDNRTGSCYDYPNVSEAREFFVSMAKHVEAVSAARAEHHPGSTGVSSTLGIGIVKYPIKLGESFEGRPIEAMCLGARCALANEEPSDPTLPQALFTGLHHAREPTSLGVLYYFVRDLVRKYIEGDAATRLLLHSRQLWFIPIVNPDGYAANCRNVQGRMVRTNMRPSCTKTHGNRGPGVDLNRNYPVCFERAKIDRSASTRPCGEDYQGTHPFSEPETAAIRDLTARQNFTFAINYHSFGKEITMPYGCKVLGKPKGNDYDIFIGLGKRITDLNGFMYGVGWEKPLDLYTVSGAAQDWMYKERGIYALMSEVGPLYHKGVAMKPAFWPTPDQAREIAEENIEANTMMAWLSGPFLEMTDFTIKFGSSKNIETVSVTVLNSGVMPASYWSVRVFVDDPKAKEEQWATVDTLPAFWSVQPRNAATPYRNMTVNLKLNRQAPVTEAAPACQDGQVLRFILLAMSGSPTSLVNGKSCVRYEVSCDTRQIILGPEICDKNVHNLVLRQPH